jgi:hypothetical protein
MARKKFIYFIGDFNIFADPVNNNEAVDAADDERFDNKGTNDEVDNNNLPDENPAEDSVDQMAQAIQQENNNGAGAAIPVPSKS